MNAVKEMTIEKHLPFTKRQKEGERERESHTESERERGDFYKTKISTNLMAYSLIPLHEVKGTHTRSHENLWGFVGDLILLVLPCRMSKNVVS